MSIKKVLLSLFFGMIGALVGIGIGQFLDVPSWLRIVISTLISSACIMQFIDKKIAIEMAIAVGSGLVGIIVTKVFGGDQFSVVVAFVASGAIPLIIRSK